MLFAAAYFSADADARYMPLMFSPYAAAYDVAYARRHAAMPLLDNRPYHGHDADAIMFISRYAMLLMLPYAALMPTLDFYDAYCRSATRC